MVSVVDATGVADVFGSLRVLESYGVMAADIEKRTESRIFRMDEPGHRLSVGSDLGVIAGTKTL